MSDEERIAKLQRLLDRVLARGDADGAGGGGEPSNGEATQLSEGALGAFAATTGAPSAPERDADATHADAPVLASARGADAHDDAPSPAALGSGSRLLTALPEPEELSEDDLVPASNEAEVTEAAAVPLVRRSKRPHEDEEPLSEGRTPLSLADVQTPEEAAEQSLAEQIAAEEARSGEIEEETPVSSRRPIDTGEAAGGPPESGKQVAASPYDAAPPGARKSTMPPAGGPAPAREDDVIRAALPAAARVAQFTTPALPRPPTFGELVDRALEL